MTDRATDYAEKIRAARGIAERLLPDRRDPHRFHEDRDDLLRSLEDIAAAVQLDQVFAKLPAHPLPERSPMVARPRTVRDRKGRSVPVETKRRVP